LDPPAPNEQLLHVGNPIKSISNLFGWIWIAQITKFPLNFSTSLAIGEERMEKSHKIKGIGMIAINVMSVERVNQMIPTVLCHVHNWANMSVFDL
jgi:hypothetical protein